MTGTIKKILSDKSFGFITAEGQEKDIFFHKDKVNGSFDDLREGNTVSFEIEESERNGEMKTSAVNVRKQ